MSSNHGCSGIGGHHTCTDPEGHHQKTTTTRGRNCGLQLEGGALRWCDRWLERKLFVSRIRNTSRRPYFINQQFSTFFLRYNETGLDYKEFYWENFIIQVKVFGLSSEVERVLHHLRDLAAYPLRLEQLRWAQPVNYLPKQQVSGLLCFLITQPVQQPWNHHLVYFTRLDQSSIFDQNSLSPLFHWLSCPLQLSPDYLSVSSLVSLCWLVHGSEPWCWWR